MPAHAPRIPGITIATRFSPGGTGTDVLGDFYDILRHDDGFGVVIGDVCGKGAQAARTTALARSAVRTAAHIENDPVAVLDTVNEILLDWFGTGRSFVTAAYATFTRTGPGPGWDVRVAGAGHPPGFLRRRSGRVVQLQGGGGSWASPHSTPDTPTTTTSPSSSSAPERSRSGPGSLSSWEASTTRKSSGSAQCSPPERAVIGGEHDRVGRPSGDRPFPAHEPDRSLRAGAPA